LLDFCRKKWAILNKSAILLKIDPRKKSNQARKLKKMNDASNNKLLVVIYDGMTNSVFQSQVLAPLLDRMRQDQSLAITLISFERALISPLALERIVPQATGITVHQYRRPPFLGTLSLLLGGWQLGTLLKKTAYDTILARGPLAGWLVQWALERLEKKPALTVQARGLGGEEYRYAHLRGEQALMKRWYHTWRYTMLKQIEAAVYGAQKGHQDIQMLDDGGKGARPEEATKWPSRRISTPVSIEAVSPALREYLVRHFHAHPEAVYIAQRDLIAPVDKQQAAAWRERIRAQLDIPATAYVYCYSGSYKPWQCTAQTLQFFADQYVVDSAKMLLVLSGDHQAFTQELIRLQLPPACYRVLGVPAKDLLTYLAAADAGFLFREPDVMNWVSRPTKLLEYQAVGLEVVHNSTIAWLVDDRS